MVASAPTPNYKLTVLTKIGTDAKVDACGGRLQPLLRKKKTAQLRQVFNAVAVSTTVHGVVATVTTFFD